MCPSDGEQQSDLGCPSFKCEQEKQRGKNKRCGNQEHAETNEQSPKIDRTLGRRPSLLCEGANLEARIFEREAVENRLGDLMFAPAIAFEPHRGVVPESVLPEFLTGAERNKSLGSGFVLVPILFVLVANGVEIDRNSRLPVPTIVGIRDAGKLGRPLGAHVGVIHRDDALHLECGALRIEFPTFAHDKVAQRDVASEGEPMIIGKPLVDGDAIASSHPIHGRDHGVGGDGLVGGD